MKQISLVLVMGLPASGKTSLCKKLLSLNFNSTDLKIVHICYDSLISIEDQITYATEDNNESKWKKARKDVVDLVEDLILGLKNEEMTVGVSRFFSDHSDIKRTRFLILIDDNLYYKSMRYDYYKIARENGLGFIQVMMKSDIDTSQKRNKERESLIPDEVISKMASRFEEPTLSNSWDNSTIFIEEYTEQSTISIWDELIKSLDNPVKPLQMNEEETIEAQIKCAKNVIHQADLILRKLVSKSMKEYTKQSSENKLKPPYEKFNSIRQLILSKMAESTLNLPVEFMSEINEENRNDFSNIISDHFYKELNTSN